MMSRAPKTPWRIGIAQKLALIVGASLCALLVGTSILSTNEIEKRTLGALERQGDAIASTLNHTFEVLVDEGALVQLQRITANTAFLPDVAGVKVIDKAGKVLACTDRTQIGTSDNSPAVLDVLGRDDFAPRVSLTETEIVIVRPLFSGRYSSNTGSGLVGAVVVSMDRRATYAEAAAAERRIQLAQLVVYGLLSLVVAFALHSIVVKRLSALADAARRTRAGDYAGRANISGNDELGDVAEAFDEMAAEIERTVGTLEENVASRTAALALSLAEKSKINEQLENAKKEVEAALDEKSKAHEQLKTAQKEVETALDDSMQANEALAAAHDDLERTYGQLVAAMQERVALAETVRVLSTPVIRVYKGILTMPLVGTIDKARAKQIEEALLAGIDRNDADEVILDLSGVPFVDIETATALIRARRCGELLGARVSFVGLRGDVARNVVAAGLDLSGLATQKDLENALVLALRRRGIRLLGRNQRIRGLRPDEA